MDLDRARVMSEVVVGLAIGLVVLERGLRWWIRRMERSYAAAEEVEVPEPVKDRTRKDRSE